jgi:pimeloyl-ACP methyl ester carboxylesterase
MNTQKLIILIFILVQLPILALEQINYGSNNGKYLTVRGTKIYYEEYGNGVPLILLSPWSGIADFSKCIPSLSTKFRVIGIDAPGTGRSDFADSAVSYPLLGDYYSKAIDLLQIDSAYVMGWSDGAEAALLLASKRPDKIKRVAVSGANYKFEGLTQEEKDDLHKLTDTLWVKENMKDWIKTYTEKSPTGNWKRFLTETLQMWFQEIYFPKSVLEAITIPTLVVYGDRDPITIEHQVEIHTAIKNSQFCVIPNCSHSVFSDKPDLISRIAVEFFEGK